MHKDAFIHCDDYIDDVSQPECLRTFLDHARSPAHGAFREDKRSTLFADYKGKRVRVVMASRFGDVGITDRLGDDYGYQTRVSVADLSGFSATKEPRPCQGDERWLIPIIIATARAAKVKVFIFVARGMVSIAMADLATMIGRIATAIHGHQRIGFRKQLILVDLIGGLHD